MNVDAKIAPTAGSPGSVHSHDSSKNVESDDEEKLDLNFDPHGHIREFDPMYPDNDEDWDDAYETDMSSDLEEENKDGTPTKVAKKKKKKKTKTEAELKSGNASSNFTKNRKNMQKEIVSLIINELVPPTEEIDIEPPAPVKRQGWVSKQCTHLGKFFGCITLDLHEAVMAGSDKHMADALEFVHQGKKSRRELCNQHNKNGTTPLCLSIKTKQPNIAFAILARKVDPDVADLETGRTPLFYACMQGKVGICQMLINAGADPNYGDFKAVTPLMMASQAKDWRTVKFICGLRRKIDYDAQDFNGWTAMHYAASKDGHKCIKWLLDAGANRRIGDMNKRTPLHIAKLGDHGDSMALLEDMKSRLAGLD
jgi:hypothetical protein